MNSDRNLLFGILAVQLRKATPAELIDAAGAWATDPSRDLAQRLIDARVLTESDRVLINRYVEEAVQAHSGDSHAALGSVESAHRTHSAILSMQRSLEATPSPDITRLSPERWLDLGQVQAVPAVDETPGRYTERSEYARGGIGRVLLVHDQYLSREIAMKELLPIVSTSGTTLNAQELTPVQVSLSLISRFLQEARITGQLEHPSIVPVYELGRRRDGTIYYTMKLVRGRTLTEAFQEAKSLRARLEMLPHLIDLCHAIGYAHSRNVIHRDIKPSNVMIGEFGETVVLDWGLAKVRGQEDVHASQIEQTLKTLRIMDEIGGVVTEDGAVLGTPVFMPPEQARGDLKNVTERSDVYSLGAVLYTLLAGQFPYGGKNAAEVLEQVLKSDPDPVESAEPNVPPELAAICRRAMDRDPRKRYANGKELAEELARFQTGAMVSAYAYGFQEHLWRFVNRHRAVLATAALFLVALLATGIFSYIRVNTERDAAIVARDAEQEQRIAAAEARDAEYAQRIKAEKQLYISSVLLAKNRIDERRFDVADSLLDSAPTDYRDWEWDYLKRLCHQDEWTFSGHTQTVEDVAVSKDGTYILTGANDGTVQVVDAVSGHALRTLDQFSGWMQHVRISPDGSKALVLVSSRVPRLMNLSDFSVLADLAGHPDDVLTARFSPDGTRIATGSVDGMVKIWDAKSGTEVASFMAEPRLLDLVFSIDGTRVIESNVSPSAVVFDSVTGARLAELAIAEETIDRVLVSPDGRWIAGAHSGGVAVWKGADFTKAVDLPDYGARVAAMAFSSDGNLFAAGSDDGSIRVWDAAAGWERVYAVTHDAAVTDLRFLGAPVRLVSSSMDHTVRVWDASTGDEIHRIEGHSGPVRRFDPSPDGKVIYTCSDDKTVRRWPVEMPADVPERRWSGHMAKIRILEFDRSGNTLLSLSEDGSIQEWDVRTGRSLLDINPNEGDFFSASWSPDGRVIATGSNTSIVQTWNSATGKLGLTLTGHQDPVGGVYFSPDGSRLLSVSWDGSAILWDMRTGSDTHHFEHADGKRALAAFNDDGKLVATITAGHNVTLWDTVSGAEKAVLIGHTDRLNRIRFSRDGTRVLTLGMDRTCRVWDAQTGASIAVMSGGISGLLDGVFSPDGTQVAITSSDNTLRIWNAQTGALIHTLEGHRDSVTTACYLQGGRRLLSGSYDGTVRIWDTGSGAAVLVLSTDAPGVDPTAVCIDSHVAAAGADGSILVWTN